MTIPYLTDAEYANRRNMCPVCKKLDIERTAPDSGDINTFRDVYCNDCHSYWVEYIQVTIKGYADLVDKTIEPPDEPEDDSTWTLIVKRDQALVVHCSGEREDVITNMLELARLEVFTQVGQYLGFQFDEDEEDGLIVSACSDEGLNLFTLDQQGDDLTLYLRQITGGDGDR